MATIYGTTYNDNDTWQWVKGGPIIPPPPIKFWPPIDPGLPDPRPLVELFRPVEPWPPLQKKFFPSLKGTSNDDIVFGYGGNDILYGYAGNDALYGGNGNDYLYGGAGKDTLTGGLGKDTLKGGTEQTSLISIQSVRARPEGSTIPSLILVKIDGSGTLWSDHFVT